METQMKRTSSLLINKTVPMEQSMITEIHQIMKEHLDIDTPISFGETARRLIKAGLDKREKIS